MPWYHFSRVFKDIAATTYQGNLGRPQFFSVSDFANATVYYTDAEGDAYPPEDYCTQRSYNYCADWDIRMYRFRQTEYSTGASLWAQLVLIVIYNLAAWYFGQTAQSDEGVSQK